MRWARRDSLALLNHSEFERQTGDRCGDRTRRGAARFPTKESAAYSKEREPVFGEVPLGAVQVVRCAHTHTHTHTTDGAHSIRATELQHETPRFDSINEVWRRRTETSQVRAASTTESCSGNSNTAQHERERERRVETRAQIERVAEETADMAKRGTNSINRHNKCERQSAESRERRELA